MDHTREGDSRISTADFEPGGYGSHQGRRLWITPGKVTLESALQTLSQEVMDHTREGDSRISTADFEPGGYGSHQGRNGCRISTAGDRKVTLESALQTLSQEVMDHTREGDSRISTADFEPGGYGSHQGRRIWITPGKVTLESALQTLSQEVMDHTREGDSRISTADFEPGGYGSHQGRKDGSDGGDAGSSHVLGVWLGKMVVMEVMLVAAMYLNKLDTDRKKKVSAKWRGIKRKDETPGSAATDERFELTTFGSYKPQSVRSIGTPSAVHALLDKHQLVP
ncbi:hypothetical protein RRG08_001906 [Elysia crispata]|uniref:Uncharacterized protein n=1 Tax=Elysia crispata TaxID=231223 RepID=A0AAE1A3S1_9GAST|nr:hypothetical protein RRG08_001906 [Elysia crispata]